MAKTNSTRQAEFRARMREEGKQALHIWVTPEQAAKVQAAINLVEPVLAAPLRVTKPTGKPAPVALPVIPTKAPASIGRMEAQIILLNAELLTRSDELEVARREIAVLENKSQNRPPGVDTLPVIPNKAPDSIVRDLTEAQAMRKKKLAQIAKLQKDADGIESWYRQTVAACKTIL